MLVDGFGPEVTGVRVSLTDCCNFDCVYCHNEGLGDTWGPMAVRDHEMAAGDVVRFLEVVEGFGVDAVKFTGGVPMPRNDLEEIVARTPDSMEVSMTTNGTFLPGRAEDLVEASLDRVTVSQDALDADAFREITQRGAYEKVIEGVRAAVEAGLDPVKLNMVLFETTVGYVPEMVTYVGEHDGLQLIEFMPELVGTPEWAVDVARVHEWLAERADRIEVREMHDRKRYWVDGGMVEIVDPVGNEEFCANCHRVRVTHEGYLKGCLNRNDDLRSMGEMTRGEIATAFRETVRERVPYGEYMVRDGEGGWEVNEAYLGAYVSADTP